MPIECVDQTAIREGVLDDHHALFGVPAFGIGVGYFASCRSPHRISAPIEGNINPGVMSAEAVAQQAEIVVAISQGFADVDGVIQRIDHAAGRALRSDQLDERAGADQNR
jgi:hypothetical protein